MIAQQVTTNLTTTVVFLNATAEECMKEFNEYREKYPPAGYGTRVIEQGIEYGFLGNGWYLIAQRSSTS